VKKYTVFAVNITYQAQLTGRQQNDQYWSTISTTICHKNGGEEFFRVFVRNIELNRTKQSVCRSSEQLARAIHKN